MKRVLTYGTFDLLHWGHIRLLKRAKEHGDYLVVAVSTDDFNARKIGKKPSYHDFDTRKNMLEAIRYVDLVIPEDTWEQKLDDVKKYAIDVVVMGSDWEGSEKFEYLRDHCEVTYLPRTEGTSTSQIRKDLLSDAAKSQTSGVAVSSAPVTGRFSAVPGPDSHSKPEATQHPSDDAATR